MVTVEETSNPIIEYGDAHDDGNRYGPSVSIPEGRNSTTKVPFIRVHVRKEMQVELFDIPKSIIGNITFSVEDVNTNETCHEEVVVPVQSVIDQVVFETIEQVHIFYFLLLSSSKSRCPYLLVWFYINSKRSQQC